MFEIVRLDHLVLRVTDEARAVAFYCDVLGCSVERRLDIGLIQLRAGDSLIDLVPVNGQLGQQGGDAPGQQGRNVDHFCLRIQPFDLSAIAAHLQQHGVSMPESAERYGADGFGESLYVSDPDGNVVELKGPPSRPRLDLVRNETHE